MKKLKKQFQFNVIKQLEILYTFPPNKFFAYLLNDEPSNLVFFENL